MKASKQSFFKLVSFLFVMMITLALTACGSSKDTATDQTGTQPDNQEQEEQISDTYEIEHAMGTTPIEGTPERIVVLTNEGADILIALGVKPVGAVKHWTGDPWYEYLADDLEGVEVVGEETEPSLEAIMNVDPDLIIGSKLRHEAIYEQLAAIAPTVMSETVGTVWKENTLLYAKAINKAEKGAELVQAWEERVVDFKEKYADKLETEVSISRFQSSGGRLYYKGFPGSIIEMVGLHRPEAQSNIGDEVVGDLTIERIPEMDGDVIFYFVSDWEGTGEVYTIQEQWMEHDLWKNLEAVKAGNVVEVNDVFWNMAGGIQAANIMLTDLDEFFATYEK
ncbi:ABC transporter substrate-binding protein [Alkalihalobacterium elongatum]|uniref:ABC transporter substrate-binding protein n=1 Tax=Alkalihalobacterium elongatum TaxID=2675466 RepID=UPI001C1FCDCC|nr:iron-siderophore ABC transporter substrate-binding protein [Alkalihalobacterium elongatum]